jgi:hypothetical protein
MTDIPKELVERMTLLVRQMADGMTSSGKDYALASSIFDALPALPDPDEELAISLAAEAYGYHASEVDKTFSAYKSAIAGIKRGRELERSGK